MLSILKKSLEDRKTLSIPPIRGPFYLLVIGVIMYICLALQMASPVYKEYHFVSEEGAVTALSAIFLAIACGFAGMTFFLDKRAFVSHRLFWLLSTLVFGFFALDELLEFHEKLGIYITQSSQIDPSGFRNWNDVVVIGYGLLGIFILVMFLPEVLRYPRLFEILCVAFLWFFLHTVIDSTVEPRTTQSVILEESFKLLCSAFLMFAMFVGLLGVVNRDYST